jgi:hypothetical protein
LKPGLIGSPAFLIRQTGEKESKSMKTIQEMIKASPNYMAKVKTQATPKARFVFAKFCNFICFRFIFATICNTPIIIAAEDCVTGVLLHISQHKLQKMTLNETF